MRIQFQLLTFLLLTGVCTGLADDFRVNDDSGTTRQLYPKIAWHPEGPAVICWDDSRNGNRNVFMQMFGRRGQPFGNNIKVNEDNGLPEDVSDSYPDVAMDAHGNFVIVWNRNGQIMTQRYAANGRAVGPHIPIVTERASGHQPRIDMNPQTGEYIITFFSESFSSHVQDVYFQRFGKTDNPLSDPIRVHIESDSNQVIPDIAWANNGRFFVVWRDKRSGTDRIFGRFFEPDGTPAGDEFEVSTHTDPEIECHNPSAAVDVNGNFVVVWTVYSEGDSRGINLSAFDSLGNRSREPFVLSDPDDFTRVYVSAISAHPTRSLFDIVWFGLLTDGSDGIFLQQYSPDVDIIPDPFLISDEDASGTLSLDAAVADWINVIAVWSDYRNGDYDIFANWHGEKLPFRTTAGSGFDGMVPISWEPPYGYTEVTRYHIHRLVPDSPPELIATINPSTRILPNLMLDFIDNTVENGVTYRYAVQLEGERDDLLIFKEATPSAGGHTIQSNWVKTYPKIDGQIEPGEWEDAGGLENISNPDADEPVRLYVKNDGTFLYIAIDDPNDDFVDPANRIGLLFDENNDDAWEAAFSYGEGMMTLSNGAQVFTPFVGDYPNDLGFETPRQAEGVDVAISEVDGHVHYETRISLTTSPIFAYAGDILGAAIWVEDPGNFYANGYGNTGEWPLNTLWDAAAPLGNLILAVPEDTVSANNWPMEGASREQDNWARNESNLHPPFDYQETFFIHDSARSNLAYVAPYLYVSYGKTPDSLHLLAYDPVLEQIPWEYHYPNPIIWGDFIPSGPSPCVSDSLALLHNGDWIVALDRRNGLQIWELDNQSAWSIWGLLILDGNRIYASSDSLRCLDLTTGEPIWSSRMYPAAVADHRRLFSVSMDTLYVQNKWTGSLIDKRSRRGEEYLTVDKLNLYAPDNDFLSAFNRKSLDTEWSYPLPGAGLINSRSQFALNDRVLCYSYLGDGADNGKLMTFDKLSGELVWEYSFDGKMIHPPVIANGVVYIIQDPLRGFGTLWAFDLEDGTRLFADQSVDYMSQPIVADGKLFASFTGGVRIFSNEAIRGNSAVQAAGIPNQYFLSQNYPNPFNPVTQIKFSVPNDSRVTIRLYDVRGRLLDTLTESEYPAGVHQITLNASDLPTGVYVYKMKAGKYTAVKKLVLMK